MTIINKIIIGTLTIFLIIACIVAVVGWYRHAPVFSKPEFTNASEMKATKKIKRIKIPVKEIETIEKSAVVKKLQLPDDVAKDETKQVTATAEIASYDGKTDIAAVLDTNTGASHIIAQQQPLPSWALESKPAVGSRGGYAAGKNDTGVQGAAYVRWDFLRIGNVHIGAYGEVVSTGDGKAMINIEYRF